MRKTLALALALSLPGESFAQTVRFAVDAPAREAAAPVSAVRFTPALPSLALPPAALRPSLVLRVSPKVAARLVVPALAAPTPEPETPEPAAAPPGPEGPAQDKILSPAALRTRRALTVLSKISGARGLWAIYRDTVLVGRFAADVSNPKLPDARRLSAARRLSPNGGIDAIPVLGLAARTDRDPQVRQAAREGVLSLAAQWTPRLLRELRFHPLRGRRLQAAQSLGVIAQHSEAPAVVEALARSASSDLNQEVRLAAIDSLSTAVSPKAQPALRWMLFGADAPVIRSALEQALAPSARSAPEAAQSRGPLYARALKRVLAIGSVFAAVEFAGSLFTKSLSLRADAMHLTADLAITAVSLFSLWMARRPPNSRRSYGYLKLESVTGLVSALAIAGMGIMMGIEAAGRLWAPVPVPGLSTLLLAFSGLASNALSTLLLYRYKDENLSLRGAFIHAATDAVGSGGIILAGFLIMKFGWFIADPLISFVIVGLILHTTWDLAKRSWSVLIDSVPEGVRLDEIEAGLLAIPGMASVADLHVWALNSSQTAMTAKLLVRPGVDAGEVLRLAKALAAARGFAQATIQVEPLN